MKLSFDVRDFLLGAAIVVALSLVILSSSKDTQISVLKKQLESIDSKHQTELDAVTESLNTIYSACLGVTECKEIYSFNVRSIFLEKAGFNESKQLRREAHLIESGLPKFTVGMDFAKERCPEFKTGPLGTLYSLYTYSSKNDSIGIIMDDDTVSIHCAWIKRDESFDPVLP